MPKYLRTLGDHTADIVSSRWIADCTMHVYDRFHPSLTLVYLPHLDYALQRLGPDDPRIGADVRAIDAICGELIEHFERDGTQRGHRLGHDPQAAVQLAQLDSFRKGAHLGSPFGAQPLVAAATFPVATPAAAATIPVTAATATVIQRIIAVLLRARVRRAE